MKLNRPLAATVTIGVLALVGCASTGGEANTDATAKTNASETAASAPSSDVTAGYPSAEPEPEEPAAPSVLKVGQAFTWEDKTTAIVTSITDATINKSFDPEPAKVVTIQVQNGGATVLDLALATVNVTFGPAGVPGEQSYDIDKGSAAIGLSGSLPPGGTQTAEYAYVNVTDASVINVEFAPTWEHQSAFWTAP